MKTKSIFTFFILAFFYSCVPSKQFVYFQDIEKINESNSSNSFELKYKPDDLLVIDLSSEEPEAIQSFYPNRISNIQSPTNQISHTYLVDKNGLIEFPVLGKIKVGGLTRTETIDLFSTRLKAYIKNPILNLQLSNFKYSVAGEVSKPGTFKLNSERVTLIEALTQAGDLTIFGKRENILLIREEDGKKTSHRIDITKSDFINSPYYYLTQNDVIYVEQNKTRRNSASIGPNSSILVSVASIAIALITLLTR